AQVTRLLPDLRHDGSSISQAEEDSPGLPEEGVAQLLLALSAQRPVCLFLDDLQWADPATGRVLYALCRQSRQAQILSRPAHILLIGSYREGEVPENSWLGPWVTELQGQRLAEALPLLRLNAGEVVRLVEQLAEGGISEALLQPLSER